LSLAVQRPALGDCPKSELLQAVGSRILIGVESRATAPILLCIGGGSDHQFLSLDEQERRSAFLLCLGFVDFTYTQRTYCVQFVIGRGMSGARNSLAIPNSDTFLTEPE